MNGFKDKKIVNALNIAATLTQTTAGNVIDMQGFGQADIHVQVGSATTADADNYFTVSLTHSDAADMTGEEAVDAAKGLLGANLVLNATTDANKVNHIGYAGNKRYIRLAVTETGTASVQVAATAELTRPNFAPVANADISS